MNKRMDTNRCRIVTYTLLFTTFLVTCVQVNAQDLVVSSSELACGVDSYIDSGTQTCQCLSTMPDDRIYIAGIFDLFSYSFGEDIFEFTVKLIADGWFDTWGILPPMVVTYSLGDSACDETQAVRAYWNIRSNNFNRPPHGIVGARCSGASMSLARIAGLENVPQVSPGSTTPKLSDKEEFPTFSRLVPPGDERGEIGAIVAMLRLFGWERVTILLTDNQFSKDSEVEFRKIWEKDHDDETGKWKGEVAYSSTILYNDDDSVDKESAKQALKGVPTDDPRKNSRIVFLIAHNQDAFDILETAKEMDFQPDTIWVGPSSWIGRSTLDNDMSWLPDYPGYLGPNPYRNRNEFFQEYFSELQGWQKKKGKEVWEFSKLQGWQKKEGIEVWEELPLFAAEMVDSILALVKAISVVKLKTGDDASSLTYGDMVVSELRGLDFDGVSGPVRFTEAGDRKDAKFSILNFQKLPNGDLSWVEVGTTDTSPGSALLTDGIGDVCFAKVGCGLKSAPDDTYPVPKVKLPAWAVIILVVTILLLVGLAVKYWRSKIGKIRDRAELQKFRDSVVGMRVAEEDYIPTCSREVERQNDTLLETLKIEAAPQVFWCWKETPQVMKQHNADVIYGDPADCWIKYDVDSTSRLEATFQEQGGKGKCSPLKGYVVDFEAMIQKKQATQFQREVKRVLETGDKDGNPLTEIDLKDARRGEALPFDIQQEPQIVLVKGDVIQISKQRSDGWAFGTKLLHKDEAVARRLVAFATEGLSDEDANVFPDTGWFLENATRVPSGDDLAALKNNVGDTGALEPPPHWDVIKNPTVVQLRSINGDDPWQVSLENEFMSTLRYPNNGKKVKIIEVSRIENLAMWQSYVVKRQTICYREILKAGENKSENTDEMQKKALERFERRWLWHGTNSEVMDKIMQQGFNRSFCGKNATAYGKGVYFARDASYSADPMYSVPDSKGSKYIMACRVVVGEYCLGKLDAVTPDVRHKASQSLYDTTVNSVANPSIYVTYHDAQAYPEYLIKFREI